MGELMLRLERAVERNRTATTLESAGLKTLVTQIGIRVSESRGQRDAFLTCSGDVLLLKASRGVALERLLPLLPVL